MNKIALICLIFLILEIPQELPEYKIAEEVAQKLIDETKSTLMKKISEAGPEDAIEACSVVALEIAKQKEKENWRVRRVSVKFRNLADEPDDFERKVLNEFERLHSKNELKPELVKAEIVEEDGKRFLRYMKPIIITGTLCLKCHGEKKDMSEEVNEKLKLLYPNDKAVGYKVGDLRGAVSIKIPLNK